MIPLYNHSFQCARDCNFGINCHHIYFILYMGGTIWSSFAHQRPCEEEWYRSSHRGACHSSLSKHVTKHLMSSALSDRATAVSNENWYPVISRMHTVQPSDFQDLCTGPSDTILTPFEISRESPALRPPLTLEYFPGMGWRGPYEWLSSLSCLHPIEMVAVD